VPIPSLRDGQGLAAYVQVRALDDGVIDTGTFVRLGLL
jgi:hypothetical protein